MRSFEEAREGSSVPGSCGKKPPRVSPIGCLCRRKPTHPGGRPDEGPVENFEGDLAFQKGRRFFYWLANSQRKRERVTPRPGHENVGAAVGHERTRGHD